MARRRAAHLRRVAEDAGVDPAVVDQGVSRLGSHDLNRLHQAAGGESTIVVDVLRRRHDGRLTDGEIRQAVRRLALPTQ